MLYFSHHGDDGDDGDKKTLLKQLWYWTSGIPGVRQTRADVDLDLDQGIVEMEARNVKFISNR